MHSKRVDIDLGVIESENGLVRDYIEKPSLRYQVSMGIYVYEDARARAHPRGRAVPVPGPRPPARRGGRAGGRVRVRRRLVRHRDRAEHERAVVDIEQFPEKYDVDAPMLDPHDLFRTLE